MRRKANRKELLLEEIFDNKLLFLDEQFALEIIETFSLTLTDREIEVFNEYYKNNKTCKQISATYDISYERISLIKRCAIRKIRQEIRRTLEEKAKIIKKKHYEKSQLNIRNVSLTDFENISKLDLSVRAHHAVAYAVAHLGVKTIGEIEDIVFSDEWKKVKYIGEVTCNEIREKLCEYFGMNLYQKHSIQEV